MVARFRRYEANQRIGAHFNSDSAATSFAVSESAGECNLNNSIDSRHSAFAVSALTPYSASVALGTHGVSHATSALHAINPTYPPDTPNSHIVHNANDPHNPRVPHSPQLTQPLTHQRTQRDGTRQRQLIIAVTANGADCGECGEHGFDQICLKPLTKSGIYHIINRYFQ